MGIKTKIEWCDSTINPIMGCSGCELRKAHCYAAMLCARYSGRKGWPKSFDEPEFFPRRIAQALGWPDLTGKTRPDKPWLDGHPRIIFVNDMGDGFCPDVDPDTWLPPQSLGSMAASPHIWLLLTKWPDRMRVFFERYQIPDNFWLGVSVENQAAADERIPILLQTPAAVRFVSCEPLLAAVDLENYLGIWTNGVIGNLYQPLIVGKPMTPNLFTALAKPRNATLYKKQLDWVIVGGESGPGARPMHPQWARDIRDQCQVAGVPFFFKQWGAWFPRSQWEGKPDLILPDDCYCKESPHLKIIDDDILHKVGKHRAGRLLDGHEHNELPSISPPRT